MTAETSAGTTVALKDGRLAERWVAQTAAPKAVPMADPKGSTWVAWKASQRAVSKDSKSAALTDHHWAETSVAPRDFPWVG